MKQQLLRLQCNFANMFAALASASYIAIELIPYQKLPGSSMLQHQYTRSCQHHAIGHGMQLIQVGSALRWVKNLSSSSGDNA